MYNVYSFSGFAKVLIKNKIKFSFRDFLNDAAVDDLIQQLINKECGAYSYVGAGIARSCFAINGCAIKVDKQFYVDYSDEDARDSYGDYVYDEDEEWKDGGWEIDELHKVTGSTWASCEQNDAEIAIYRDLIKSGSDLLNYIPKLYATSSNNCVEVMEYCDGCYDCPRGSDPVRWDYIVDHFEDTHDGNFGFNSQGKLVLLDLGFGVCF